jgi:hypothetical protein
MVGSGATVGELGRGGVLKHPRWRGHPPDKWVKAAAHLSFLPMRRGGKIGMAVAFSDEVGALVAGVVLHQGGMEEGAQVQVYLEKKAARGVLGALLTMEWVTMAEAIEAPAIGWLLAASSCTDGEKVVRGDGLTGGGVEHGRAVRHARTVRRWRSDSEAAARPQTATMAR